MHSKSKTVSKDVLNDLSFMGMVYSATRHKLQACISILAQKFNMLPNPAHEWAQWTVWTWIYFTLKQCALYIRYLDGTKDWILRMCVGDILGSIKSFAFISFRHFSKDLK